MGEEVLAADFNAFVQQQVVSTFANTAARDTWTSPPNGARCVTLDTNANWERRNGAWRRSAPGVLVQNWSNAAFESGDIGASPVVVLTAPVPFELGRTYLIVGALSMISRTGGGTNIGIVRLVVGGTHLTTAQSPAIAANTALPLSIQYHYLAAATSTLTVSLDLAAAGGSNPVRFMAAAGYPNGLSVIDQGYHELRHHRKVCQRL